MSIYNILEIAFGVLTAKLVIGVINEGYRFKWQRVRLEFNRIFRSGKRQKEKVEIPRKSKRITKTDVPLIPDVGGSKTTGEYAKPSKRCAFPRFFYPPN